MAAASRRVMRCELDPNPNRPCGNLRLISGERVAELSGPKWEAFKPVRWVGLQVATVAGERFSQLHAVGHFNGGVH